LKNNIQFVVCSIHLDLTWTNGIPAQSSLKAQDGLENAVLHDQVAIKEVENTDYSHISRQHEQSLSNELSPLHDALHSNSGSPTYRHSQLQNMKLVVGNVKNITSSTFTNDLVKITTLCTI
jgi:hypothetical protein